MKVVDVTARPVNLVLRTPMALLGGSVSSIDNVLVEVHTSDGVVGLSEATPRPAINGESVASVVSMVTGPLAAALQGVDVGGLSAIEQRLQAVAGNPIAKSAVETAALDGLAKTLGVSCHSLLGGFATEVPVAALLPLGDPKSVAELADELRTRHGITAFKIKVGRDIDRDEAAVKEVRGRQPDATLCADANGGFTPVDAKRFLRFAQEYGLVSVEEPVKRNGQLPRNALLGRPGVEIVGDESCGEVDTALAALKADDVTALTVKVGRTGVSGSSKLRSVADWLGAPVIMGYEHVSSLGAAASLAFAASAPSTALRPTEVIAFLDFVNDLTHNPLVVTGGIVRVPAGFGFGMELHERVAYRS
jgi:L-alanine-DL-glutamate epimerase-like enolase superfamily enzyme